MINGLDIYYSKNIRLGLRPFSNKKNSFWIKNNF